MNVNLGSGDLLTGRYRLVDELGRGGMGVVWRAKDELLGREVAVKEVKAPRGLDDDQVRQLYARLEQEGRAAARVDHPNVITVYDVAKEDGRPWIVMELVRGMSLADLVGADGPLSPERAAEVGAAVLAALRVAHEAGVLHRDVKPGNVLISHDGRVVLTDFGIAVIEGSSSITRTGELVGSPEFLAPERALGQTPGPGSDLWSLGVTLYAVVEGCSPFRRTSALTTLQAVVDAELPAPQRAGALTPVLQGLLCKDPEWRIDGEHAQRMLEEVAAGVASAATLRSAPAGHPPTVTSTGPAPGEYSSAGAAGAMASAGLASTMGPPTVAGPGTSGTQNAFGAEGGFGPPAGTLDISAPSQGGATTGQGGAVTAAQRQGEGERQGMGARARLALIAAVVLVAATGGSVAVAALNDSDNPRSAARGGAGAATSSKSDSGSSSDKGPAGDKGAASDTGQASDEGGKSDAQDKGSQDNRVKDDSAQDHGSGGNESSGNGTGKTKDTADPSHHAPLDVTVYASAVRSHYSGPCPPPAAEAPHFTATIKVTRTPAQVKYRWVTSNGGSSDPSWKVLSFGPGDTKQKVVSHTETSYHPDHPVNDWVKVEISSPKVTASNTVPFTTECTHPTEESGGTESEGTPGGMASGSTTTGGTEHVTEG